MKALRKVLQTGLVVAAVGLTMGAANAEDLLDKVTEAGELKVALEGTYPPFNYRNTKGELEGFDVDVPVVDQYPVHVEDHAAFHKPNRLICRQR